MALILATFILAPETLAQVSVGGQGRSTVLPTDVVPLPLAQERQALGESFKFRLFQRLPLRFYMNATVETSGRFETNVFQFPTRRTILNRATFDRGEPFAKLTTKEQETLIATANKSSAHDNIYRVTPNITAGWALGPKTNIFVNYFYLRDKLARYNQLNTFINQVGAGIEHNIPVGKKANLELQYMSRELFQANSKPVYDYLPSTTLTYFVRPNTIAYLNSLVQFRSLQFFGAVNREIDPFFTIGAVHQRGPWSFSANMTYLNNFRHGFPDASLKLNSQTIICDFEVAKQLFKKIPGFQGFIRAEPVYNFATNQTPGLAGMDFRIFYGVRATVSKPVIATSFYLKKYRQKLQEPNAQPQNGNGQGENTNQKENNGTPTPGTSPPPKPTDPTKTPEDGKSDPEKVYLPGGPSADTIEIDDIVLDAAAPMHGFITESGKEVADATLISNLDRAKPPVN